MVAVQVTLVSGGRSTAGNVSECLQACKRACSDAEASGRVRKDSQIW
jgi:hypothetical protein